MSWRFAYTPITYVYVYAIREKATGAHIVDGNIECISGTSEVLSTPISNYNACIYVYLLL